jgi:hypothetical protein
MKITIPVKSMESDGEDGKPVMPGVGEEIMLPDVMAVVDSIDGDKINVTVKSVGGCECGEEDDSEKESEPTEESVMKMAKKMDEE